MIDRRESIDLTTTFTAEAEAFLPSPAATPPHQARFLLLLKGRGGVQVVELGPTATKIVGRAAPADFVVDDASLSRQHARIRWQPEGVLVEDLNSKNGTRCSGESVESVLVRPGMAVELGNVTLVVRQAQDIERRGFEDFERFASRLEDELLRARTLARPLSLLMLRALKNGHEHTDAWWLRVRTELRAIDTISVYAPDVLLILLPELAPSETRFVAQSLVQRHPDEPILVCGVATLQQAAHTSHELIEAARRACRSAAADRQVVLADASRSEAAGGEALVTNAAMQEIYRLARRVASHAAPLLILGETGTGKELVARYTHDVGARRDKPFRAINCAAIPTSLVESVLFGHERGAFTGASDTRKGVFEDAHGGTLFLDEVGELPLAAQAALLRVLENKQLTRIGGTRQIDLDVRVVSATHCDLEAMVTAKTFRADLYHRLNLLTVRVPALRERPDEIESLALLFLRSRDVEPHTQARSIASDALEALRAHDWPGNVRELRNVIERAALLCDGAVLELEDLPERLRSQWSAPAPAGFPGKHEAASTGGFADKVRRYEMQLIREALSAAHGNQTKAAELLDMPLRTLVYKIRSYGMRSAAGRSATN
jgi:DNA-binding NtrC family response regulator